MAKIIRDCMVYNKKKDDVRKYEIVSYECNVKKKNECMSIDIKGQIRLKCQFNKIIGD